LESIPGHDKCLKVWALLYVPTPQIPRIINTFDLDNKRFKNQYYEIRYGIYGYWYITYICIQCYGFFSSLKISLFLGIIELCTHLEAIDYSILDFQWSSCSQPSFGVLLGESAFSLSDRVILVGMVKDHNID
jgi:hypothetical protein